MNKLMTTIYKFLDNFYNTGKDKKFLGKLLLFVFSPLFFLFELLVYNHYWNNIIKIELFTNDNVINFLDKNDFEYKGNKLFKIDLLSENPYFDSLKLEDAKKTIRAEYADALIKLFENELVFDIENYINLLVDVDYKGIYKNEEYYKAKVYSVTIRFCRALFLIKTRKRFIIWLITITPLIYLFLRYIFF